MRTRERTRRLRRVAGLVGLAVLLTACSGEQTLLDPQGPFSADPDRLFDITLIIAGVVFVVVQGLIVYSIMRFRAQPDDDEIPEQIHGNTRLEILWTVIPALILAGLAVPTTAMIFQLDEEPDDAMIVEVIGHRWWWEYRYPDLGITTANELVMPVGVPIRLEMRAEESGSDDRGVLHSYWLPALAGKQDVIPGRMVTLNMQADVAGRYLGMCTEYCGLSHANMRNRGVALEQADFDAWAAAQQAPAAETQGDLALRGAELFGELGNDRQSCVQCHAVRRTQAEAMDSSEFTPGTGPDLTHLMSRKEFAGAIFDLYLRVDPDDPNSDFTDQPNVEALEAWLRDPPGMKAMTPADGIGMPNLNLTEDEIDALVAYLLTLE